LKRSIEENLLQHPSFIKKDFKKAVADVIHIAEMNLLHDPIIDTDLSGSTMVLVIICNNTMMVANIGDSRAILGRTSGVAIPLTIDHKPCSPFEKFRIVSMGGRVFPITYSDGVVGPDRVWLGNKNLPGLAMSRSLCDSVAHEAGVISAPDIFESRIDISRDHMLVIATDGLWDVMSNEEVIRLCADKAEPSMAVTTLIKEARQRWNENNSYMDDTTVCVVSFYSNECK
jgi:serine/threonine protein phosphatase PrpC